MSYADEHCVKMRVDPYLPPLITPETLLRKLFYRDLESVAQERVGIFTDPPTVDWDGMEKLRSGEAE